MLGLDIGWLRSASGVPCSPSGLAMNPSWRLGRDVLVAHGPEGEQDTPLADEPVHMTSWSNICISPVTLVIVLAFAA